MLAIEEAGTAYVGQPLSVYKRVYRWNTRAATLSPASPSSADTVWIALSAVPAWRWIGLLGISWALIVWPSLGRRRTEPGRLGGLADEIVVDRGSKAVLVGENEGGAEGAQQAGQGHGIPKR
ncbi:hypothetical protein [Fimbriimonas ginsengisoli]|uniref:hypothetical protein n=1 Tax=Fimbriimonas ginsengisoli TaxID=1005039 RepID=UPI00046D943E|nr:hypothetical protein [Fimbriimonas ginsengisoli]